MVGKRSVRSRVSVTVGWAAVVVVALSVAVSVVLGVVLGVVAAVRIGSAVVPTPIPLH